MKVPTSSYNLYSSALPRNVVMVSSSHAHLLNCKYKFHIVPFPYPFLLASNGNLKVQTCLHGINPPRESHNNINRPLLYELLYNEEWYRA
jgi:hypothetical protein